MRKIIECIIIVILTIFCLFTLARADLVTIARNEIGNGELGGNNKGIYVEQYLNWQTNLPWCAGFVSYCLKKNGNKIPYLLRAKSFADYGKQLTIKELKSGDLVIFNRQGGGHIGIIEKINKDSFISIEGNVGNYPAKVKRITHQFSDNKIYKFVRILW